MGERGGSFAYFEFPLWLTFPIHLSAYYYHLQLSEKKNFIKLFLCSKNLNVNEKCCFSAKDKEKALNVRRAKLTINYRFSRLPYGIGRQHLRDEIKRNNLWRPKFTSLPCLFTSLPLPCHHLHDVLHVVGAEARWSQNEGIMFRSSI